MIDDYIGIGGNAVEQEANEGIADIPGNRTLMVNQMTARTRCSGNCRSFVYDRRCIQVF